MPCFVGKSDKMTATLGNGAVGSPMTEKVLHTYQEPLMVKSKCD